MMSNKLWILLVIGHTMTLFWWTTEAHEFTEIPEIYYKSYIAAD